MGIVKRRAGGISVPAGSGSGPSSSTSINDLDFESSVVDGGAGSSAAVVDLSRGFNHIFRVTESVLVTASGWKNGSSFTVDLINDSGSAQGVSWQGFDFLGEAPTEIENEARHVFTGKCVLSEDGSQQYFQIASVGTGGSV